MNFLRKSGIRLSCLALGILCLFVLAQPVAAVQAEQTVQPFTLTCNVYWWDSVDSRIIGQLAQGTALRVLDETEDFYEIDCYGMTGYILKSDVLQVAPKTFQVNCSATDEEAQLLHYFSHSAACDLRQSVVQIARWQLGVPYVLGGATPAGFDCAGFTAYLYACSENYIRMGASSQMQDGLIIAQKDLQIGDLLYFRIGDDDSLASHVGVYVGNDQMIHAGSAGICYTDLRLDYWTGSYIGARRIVVTNPETSPRLQSIDPDLQFNSSRVLLQKNGPSTVIY